MIPVVETVGLTHRYGRHTALQDVDLVIPEGSLYALLGPNGAGKTTLLKILLGLLQPSEGAVRLTPAGWLIMDRLTVELDREVSPVDSVPNLIRSS